MLPECPRCHVTVSSTQAVYCPRCGGALLAAPVKPILIEKPHSVFQVRGTLGLIAVVAGAVLATHRSGMIPAVVLLAIGVVLLLFTTRSGRHK